jgi:hypothetical protein
MAFNPRRKLMKIAAGDPAWLNATFALLALAYDLHTTHSTKISSDALYYRGQALRLVNERLANPSSAVDNSTIGAVATLCNFDVMSGSQGMAEAHMSGLQQLLRIRGGIDKLPSEHTMLLSVVSWCDIAFAGSWGGAPRFPEVESLSTPPQLHIRNCKPEKVCLLQDETRLE